MMNDLRILSLPHQLDFCFDSNDGAISSFSESSAGQGKQMKQRRETGNSESSFVHNLISVPYFDGCWTRNSSIQPMLRSLDVYSPPSAISWQPCACVFELHGLH
jgi:hypothetical protein